METEVRLGGYGGSKIEVILWGNIMGRGVLSKERMLRAESRMRLRD